MGPPTFGNPIVFVSKSIRPLMLSIPRCQRTIEVLKERPAFEIFCIRNENILQWRWKISYWLQPATLIEPIFRGADFHNRIQSCKNVPNVPTSWCYFFQLVLIFGPFWIIFGPFWQFWVIFGLFWVILGNFWAIFWVKKLVGANFLRFCNSGREWLGVFVGLVVWLMVGCWATHVENVFAFWW